MSKILPFKSKNMPVSSLIELAQEYDQVSRKYLLKGEKVTDVAGIMANRLGEIIRVFDGDKELLREMLITILTDRSNYK